MKSHFAIFSLLSILLCGVEALSAGLDLSAWEKKRVLSAADSYMMEAPITITLFSSPRSAGGLHDFFSEGDYWWPDPKDTSAPYIQRDGMTNPENFTAHRSALMRLSVQVPALVAAFHLTGKRSYAEHAMRHLRAWFVADATRMNPHLLYAQAIKGRATGRGIGIIDTIHLVEVAKSIEILIGSSVMSADDSTAIVGWFAEYLRWMSTHQYGHDEQSAKNNHGTCWVFQAAAFAHLAGDTATIAFCRKRFKEVLIPEQMAADGSFPLELKRTKPYSYSLFNLEVLGGICQLLSSPADNLWTFTLPDGRSMSTAVSFLFPFIKDKSTWPYAKDVMYWKEWPVRQSSLLFAGNAYGEQRYFELWKTLKSDPTQPEVIRNFPIRQPILWLKQ